MTTNELTRLLENRHTAVLEWVEPWPACGPEGDALDAHVTLRASVHDCVNLQRQSDMRNGLPTSGDDLRRLDEFIVVHWATARELSACEQLLAKATEDRDFEAALRHVAVETLAMVAASPHRMKEAEFGDAVWKMVDGLRKADPAVLVGSGRRKADRDEETHGIEQA
jgi:hypothetical protein